jgi:hypothetical protein
MARQYHNGLGLPRRPGEQSPEDLEWVLLGKEGERVAVGSVSLGWGGEEK